VQREESVFEVPLFQGEDLGDAAPGSCEEGQEDAVFQGNAGIGYNARKEFCQAERVNDPDFGPHGAIAAAGDQLAAVAGAVGCDEK
jgi:hypothetical protein